MPGAASREWRGIFERLHHIVDGAEHLHELGARPRVGEEACGTADLPAREDEAVALRNDRHTLCERETSRSRERADIHAAALAHLIHGELQAAMLPIEEPRSAKKVEAHAAVLAR